MSLKDMRRSDVQDVSACPSCKSPRRSFISEIGIHFRGTEGLNKPLVWVSREVLVCGRCGRAEFVVPEKERQALNNENLVETAETSV